MEQMHVGLITGINAPLALLSVFKPIVGYDHAAE